MEQGLEIFLIAADNPVGSKQRRIFKRKRAGEVLTREQVKAIKAGRKLLRRQMKRQGLKRKEDFELAASSLGLYFDKRKFFLLWFFRGWGLWALLGALALLLTVLFLYSTVTAMRGMFTINMSDGAFKQGFVLSETEDFRNPTTHLFCIPAEDVPCISISHIPEDIDQYEGQHNDNYFAYTFWLRNEGDNTVDYSWTMNLNSESKDLSKAAWVMVFEDGVMSFYAEIGADGQEEALPAKEDDSRGYIGAPMMQFAGEPEKQYELIKSRGSIDYYRVIPKNFVSEKIVAQGYMAQVDPMEVHKYTVVIWLEGDDPDCTNDMIGGHLGLDIYIRLAGEELDDTSGHSSWGETWENTWNSLKFWE